VRRDGHADGCRRSAFYALVAVDDRRYRRRLRWVGEPRSCVICHRCVGGGDADRLKDDRCPACYQHRQRHGHDRPDAFDTVVDVLHRPGWMRDGLCNEYPDLPWIGPATAVERRAMFDVCAGCLVRDECQGYTVDHLELVGVWAGRLLDGEALEAERERRRERGRRYAAAVRRRRTPTVTQP
jgi:hypothetical protein